jgi:RNA-binding protein YhbY
MKLKNISTRLHWIGEESIAPGETKEVPDAYDGAFNANDLVKVEIAKSEQPEKPEVSRRGRNKKESDE